MILRIVKFIGFLFALSFLMILFASFGFGGLIVGLLIIGGIFAIFGN